MKRASIIIFLLLISILIVSCSGNKKNQFQFPPTQVSAYTVKTGQASYHVEYPATVVALNQIEIRPEVSGYLTDIYFKDGQHVTKGMKLYKRPINFLQTARSILPEMSKDGTY